MSNDKISIMFISTDSTIKNAMEVIEKGGRGIALVVDNDRRLLGIITDSDVRRAILKDVPLNNTVKSIMNEHFTFVSTNYTKKLVQTIFEQKSIIQLPVLDDNMRVTDIIYFNEFNKKISKDNYAIVMAGGLGTRLSPLTKDIPKPMLMVGARPILETIIEQLKSFGFINIILSLNYKGEMIENYFQDGSNFGVNISYIKEKKRLGTAGAIKLAEKYLDKSFFVTNGDVLTKLNFEQFMQFHKKNNNAITIGTKKYELQIPYGVVDIKNEAVTRLNEKPMLNFFINAGMYCLEPETIGYIPKNKYFDITQLIDRYINEKRSVGSYPIMEYWMDIGQMDDYKQANLDYNDLFTTEKKLCLSRVDS